MAGVVWCRLETLNVSSFVRIPWLKLEHVYSWTMFAAQTVGHTRQATSAGRYIEWHFFHVFSIAKLTSACRRFSPSSLSKLQCTYPTKRSHCVGCKIVSTLFWNSHFFSLCTHTHLLQDWSWPIQREPRVGMLHIFKYRLIIVVAIYMNDPSCYVNSCHFYLSFSRLSYCGTKLYL